MLLRERKVYRFIEPLSRCSHTARPIFFCHSRRDSCNLPYCSPKLCRPERTYEVVDDSRLTSHVSHSPSRVLIIHHSPTKRIHKPHRSNSLRFPLPCHKPRPPRLLHIPHITSSSRENILPVARHLTTHSPVALPPAQRPSKSKRILRIKPHRRPRQIPLM